MSVRRTTEIGDTELFIGVQRSDMEAFSLLYHQYWHPLFSFANKLLRSYDDAQDIVQTVFLSIWERRDAIVIQQSIESYLHQAVRFQSLKKLESILSSPEQIDRIQEELLPAFNDILHRLQEQDLVKQLEKEISGLPPRTREIFLLSRQYKLSIAEIALKLGISEQTVKNQLHIALKALRHSIAVMLIIDLVTIP
ncbi:RNA polymerase sigma-70 factor [Chitinophaga sp. G-6-1-13]|uniref:RNA polymerase sigma-70 factor n=1 Tax=Chitinophaga fulva TaxID=2728842 RepID=A0A848GLX9_9BACT|nr:RNA polymerase sigma-70 factor [Chitinophaga fulva]NML39615.1 RNA polymerase sigma-70 factor [Chitinophaga fulva]